MWKICNENFQSQRAIKIHFEMNHEKEPESESKTVSICEKIVENFCDQCNKYFNSNMDVNKHKNELHPAASSTKNRISRNSGNAESICCTE